MPANAGGLVFIGSWMKPISSSLPGSTVSHSPRYGMTQSLSVAMAMEPV